MVEKQIDKYSPTQANDSHFIIFQTELRNADLYLKAAKLSGVGNYQLSSGKRLPSEQNGVISDGCLGIVILTKNAEECDTFWAAYDSLNNAQPKD